MAKVCDVDSGREDVEVVDISSRGDEPPVDSHHQGPGMVDLSYFDACAPCRAAIESGGLPELMQRYGAAHKLLKRPRKPT